MEIRYSYRDAPTVKAFARDDTFLRGLQGPFGSGKSSGCVIEIVRRAMAQEPGPDGVRRTRWAIIRNTYGQLNDTSIKTFHQWLPPAIFGKYNKTDHDYTITGFDGVEIEVMFRALDRPDQVDNLLSLELTGAWVNEAREVPWSVIQALQGRVGRYPSKKDGGPTWFGVFMDTNPPDQDSWWYKLFEERRPDNAKLFKQPSGRSDRAENKANLPPNYYENLAAGATDPEWVKVYVDGEYGFVIDGKPVYPEYSDSMHCRETPVVPKLPIHRGWDFGLTPACVFSQLAPNGQWRIFDELTAESLGIERFADAALMHCSQEYPGHEFIDTGDPAGGDRAQTDERSCFEIMRGKGIDVQPGEQSPAIRQESVRFPLNHLVDGLPALVVDPKCKMLRKGFQGGYQFRRLQTRSERYTEKPDKNAYSHPHDALQYTATRLFGSLVRNRMEPDDEDEFVITSDGRSPIGGY